MGEPWLSRLLVDEVGKACFEGGEEEDEAVEIDDIEEAEEDVEEAEFEELAEDGDSQVDDAASIDLDAEGSSSRSREWRRASRSRTIMIQFSLGFRLSVCRAPASVVYVAEEREK